MNDSFKILGVLFVIITLSPFGGLARVQHYSNNDNNVALENLSVGDSLLYIGSIKDVRNESIADYPLDRLIPDFPVVYTKMYSVIETEYTRSFLITGFNLPSVYANTTEKYVQDYTYYLEKNWDLVELINGSAIFAPSGNYSYEHFMNDTYTNCYAADYNSTSVTNFDFVYITDESVYVDNYNATFTINNVEREINVNEYQFHTVQSFLTSESKFDISYDANYTYVTDVTVLVDTTTKLIIQINKVDFSYYWYAVTKFSNEYNSTLDLERFQKQWTYTNLTLTESTTGYGNWQDADLPGIYFLTDIYNLVAVNDQDVVIQMYIADISPVTLSVYIDEHYWEVFSNVSGRFVLSIPESVLIPNLNGSLNRIAIFADDNNGHISYWSLNIDDQRTFNATWAPYLEVPDYVELNLSTDQVFVDIFASTVWWTTVYFKENDSWVPFEDYYGYKNDTIAFSMNIFLPGTFEIKIALTDYSNNTVEKVITVKYDPLDLDTEPPTITGPEGEIILNQGEEQDLIWTIEDDHLSLIQLYVNETLQAEIIPTNTYFELTFNTQSITQYPATYIITVVAYDLNNRTSSKTLTIKVLGETEETTNTTTIATNTTNTENIISTNINTGKISFPVIFSISILFIIPLFLRKRKK